MPQALIYTAFHLNLAFSSIEEEDRKAVIDRCYWPLLKLAEDGYPIGIEATSYTLRDIKKRDPSWIVALRKLISLGLAEFIGSGYTQMIAPLVPAELTEINLALGMQDYHEILGVSPKIALINEQAYSPGILPLYKAAGFDAVMMDWSEPSSHNHKWSKNYAHRPQVLLGAAGMTLPVVWADAMSFQKFQRYAHAEIGADEYFEFMGLQLEQGACAFPVYTSDAEIFDYRPGRFGSEASIGAMSEYERISLLMRAFASSGAVEVGTPSDALTCLAPNSTPIRLETARAPLPVKKQRKYNILRWAVTGRDDLALNTACWRFFESVFASDEVSEEQQRLLCEIWASDFRTHVTEKRWQGLLQKIGAFDTPEPEQHDASSIASDALPSEVIVKRESRFLIIETPKFHLALNCSRGLAIQSFGPGKYAPNQAGAPAENGLIGTLAHGFFDDIEYGADFYSGHFVAEPSTGHKITDLVKCEPSLTYCVGTNIMRIAAYIDTGLGRIQKTITFEIKSRSISVSYKGISFPLTYGSFRCGHVMVNPQAFQAEGLYFEAQNGGRERERHSLWDKGLVPVDHGASVSRLVSASTGLGLTDGVLELGDAKHFIKLTMQRSDAAGLGLITAKTVSNSFFVRAAITLGESDETVKLPSERATLALPNPIIRYSIEFGEQPK